MGDAEQAVIRLRLRKPPHWRWALHTSRSAPAVRVLEDGAGRDSGASGGAPAGGVELLVDVAEASERRCSPRVRAILADEGLPVSRSASARLRSAASGGNAVLKQKSDSSLERRAKGTGFGLATPRVPSTSDVPKGERSDSHNSSTTGGRTPSARVQNQQTAPGGLEKPETGEAKFQSRIARPVTARKTLPDAGGASGVEQSRLPCLRSASGEKSEKPADVTKRYSDSSLGSLSKVVKLRNRLSQSSTGTDTPDVTESVLSDSSVPTVRSVSGSPSVTGSDSAENFSVMKELPSRVPVQHKSVSCRSSSVKETKKRHPSTNTLRREEAPLEESQQVRRSNRNKNDLHYKIRKEVPTPTPTDGIVKSQPASTRKERTSDPSKDCARKPTSTRSQGVRNTSSQRSQPSKVEEAKRIKQPQQRSTTLPEVQSSYHRKSVTSRSKEAAAEMKQACVKKQKSDSSLDSTFSSTAAEANVHSKSKIPLGHIKLDATARNPSHLATGAYGTHTQLASVRPVGGGTANKPLRPTIIPRLACSSEKPSEGRRRAAEAESNEMSSSVEEMDAVNNVSRASSVKCEGQRSPRTRTKDMDDVCLDVSVEVASCGGNSGSRGRSPECDAMYVAYVVTTPDSEIGAPVYRVDSPSVTSVCDVEIVPFDDDLEAEPVFRPARRYFGYGGSFKRLSDLDEKDLAADRSERRSSSFGSRPSRPCSNSGSSASGSVDTNKPGQRTGQYSSRLEKLFRDKDVTSSPGKKTVEQSLTKSTENDTTRRKTSCKQSNIPMIRVSPQKEDVKKASGKRNPKHSAGLYSYLLKYRPSGEQFSDPEVLSVATETVSGMSRTGHARGDSGVYSLNGSMRDRNKQRLAPPAVEEQQQKQQQQKQQQSGRKRRRRHRRRTAEHQGCGGCDVGGGEAMGSSASRQPGGLAGRRAHSSGSLPRTAGAASAMAASGAASTAGPAPGARGRSCGGGGGRAGKLCKDRAKLCGSLPNHLDCNDASNGLDQGYGSERSPDDEEDDDEDDDDDEEEEEDDGDESTCHCATYPFLNTDSAFEVHLVKGSRGLGLSVCGGADSSERWPGLVRVKRLFPQQPAWLSGRLQPGDILLAANGVSLVGLTDYQALEVLRRTPSRVSLRVVRPPGSLVPAPPPAPGQPPPPPRRDAHLSHQQLLPPPPSHADDTSREFDIVLTKVNRSLGFTLRKEDESVLGHYVRALVREPALSDGRIRPGDKIVAVNDVDISPMSHEEAVMFLRQCGDVVKLRLYRDESQTPVSALSPTEEEKPFKPKPLLRKEARDMLTDLAVRKMSPGESSYSGSRLRRVSADSSPCSSPRRRHLTRSSPSENKAATLERMPAGQKYMVSSQSQTSTSDSSEEHSQNNSNTLTCSSSADADADSTRARGHASSFSSTAGSVGEPVKPLRPNFLDLCGAVGSMTPQTRKPRLVFGSSGEAEWEEDEGDPPPEPAPGSPCPRYSSSCCSSSGGGDMMPLATDSVEPVSMPPLSSTSSTSTAFSYRNPAYQSAVDATGHRNQSDRAGTGTSGAGAGGLLKWKGVVFTPEDGNGPANGLHCPPETAKAPDAHLPADYEPGDQIFMVELTRGWNSRLGFSLQGNGQHTYISAIYADSVAAKDGRLQAGDRVLMVNDENVETMSTADVIDLLRKIRGTIGITVLRKHKQELTTPTT